jgi:DNA-binding NtrC family response regulator
VPPLRERKEDIFMLFRKFTVDVAEKYHITPVRLDDRAKLLLENYNWPGNIRELKNLAEKVSILSEEREISAEQLLDIFPTIKDRHLPALTKNGKEDQGLQEREILYKLLFDMKSDLNDLKSLIYELIRDNDLQVPDNNTLKTLTGPVLERDLPSRSNESRSNYPGYTYDHEEDEEYEEERTEEDLRPMIIREEGRDQDEYGSVEIIDENLSLEYHEKNLIEKALKKHNGRRKDAAEDLGISERTLYRKIKQYNLQ